ncbi:MAG: S9 family peptidase [Acidobacteriota bacterium]
MRAARSIALATLLVALPALAPAQPRPVTVDDVLGLKAVGAAIVSPDGTQVLYTVRQWEPESERERDRMAARTRIWRVPAAGGPGRQITYGERGDSQPQWSPDGRFISFVSARGAASGGEEARAQIYLMRADGGEAFVLTAAKEGVSGYAWAPDSSRIAYLTTDPLSVEADAARKKRDDARIVEADFRHQHLWTIDVATKTATQLTEGTAFTVMGAPTWAPDGTRLAFAARPTPMLRDYRADVYIAEVSSKTVEKITSNPDSDASPAWSPDGRTIAFLSEVRTPARPSGQVRRGQEPQDGTPPSFVGHARLMLYDVATRQLSDASRADFDIDPGAPRWLPDSSRILFTAGRRAYTEAFVYDVAAKRYTQLTTGRTVQIGSISRDGRTVALIADSPTDPAEVHVTDPTFATLRRLTTTNPQAADFALGETEIVTWKSTDGWPVEGILLKPVGYEAGKRYPLLVVAHGGPAGAYTNGYRVGGLEGGQYLAGQGWAVFYPNPRGSTNYGEKFLQANLNDWGGGDYRDIMSGIDHLVARGIADPDKLAHIGWSYGGYMTAWVITQTTRFKAAMVGAGLTNMWSMYGTNDIPNVLVSYFGGYPDKETMRLYLDRSAMTHVDRVTTPTLILHGANDERVPLGQAQELFRGLKDRGKATELVVYPREGHGISEYYHLKDRLTRIRDWITRYTLGEAAGKTSQR